jgi:uridine kinase
MLEQTAGDAEPAASHADRRLARDEPTMQDALRSIRASQAPKGIRWRVVAVDGHGGSGKSSLAEWLADALDAPVIHTDDFASWDNPIDWWPALLEKVLRPLAEGQPARYVPNSWGGPPRPEVTIEPTDFVLLEGVTATRTAFRPYLAFSIWVETPGDLRLRRGLERDGEATRGQWYSSMEEEDRYVADERPAAHADLILPGDRNLWIRGTATEPA